MPHPLATQLLIRVISPRITQEVFFASPEGVEGLRASASVADTLARVELSVRMYERKAADFQRPNVWIRESLSPRMTQA